HPAVKASPRTDTEAFAVDVTRRALSDILKGKLEPALLTPARRAKLSEKNLRQMGASLRGYGKLKTVTFVARKKGESADVCTLKATFGETLFIATVTITKAGRIDDLKLIEY